MSLSSNVQTRINTQRLAELTNPEDPNAAAIDATRLNAAIADVEGDFLRVVGVVYDDANAAHVRVGVDGVVLRLRQLLGNAKLDDEIDAYEGRLKSLAAGQGGRQRVVPSAGTGESDQDERLRGDLEPYIASDLTADPSEDD